ncbi:MAG: Rab family GTPase [Promethearchaeota archaeon]
MTFKLLITGDGGVGKTTLTQKYVTGLFKSDTRITIGVDFHTKDVVVDGKRVKLQIWDFGGEERFRFLLPSYCRGASGALFLYSITSYASLSHLPDWMNIINQEAGRIPVLLVGSKLDLAEYRKVPPEEAVEFARQGGLMGYVEVSAKDGTNVEETFEAITRLMIQNRNANR